MMPLSRDARRWSLRELARRASLSGDFLENCSYECTDAESILWLPDGASSIRFRNVIEAWDELALGKLQTSRAEWMTRPSAEIERLVGDFIVPHCAEPFRRPLLERRDEQTIVSQYDLPASVLFMLTRHEETIGGERDEHDRFPASSCTAYRDGFPHRPVVDEYGLALNQAIEVLLPSVAFELRRLRVKLSHDCDEVGLWPTLRATHGARTRGEIVDSLRMLVPAIRAAVAQATHHGSPAGTGRDLLKIIGGGGSSFLQRIRELAWYSQTRGLDSAFYWKASVLGRHDSGYDPRSRPVANLIAELRNRGFENGVHPGYDSFRQPEILRRELEIARQAIGQEHIGGRQHYLRWSPESWADWEGCGLAYDSSVGFCENIGFRAGTCVPYRPWLPSQDREARLLEIPLIVMDVALLRSPMADYEAAFAAVQDCIERCRMVGGVFTLLCHNTTLAQRPGFVGFYKRVLDSLLGAERFNWQQVITEQSAPGQVLRASKE